MKIIRNIKTLESILNLENHEWQKVIFSQLGVVVVPRKGEQDSWNLISACGCSDLFMDEDSEEGTITINSVAELIDYINNMPIYQKGLRNIKIGSTTKSDIFWAINYRVLYQNRYPESVTYYENGNWVTEYACNDYVYGLDLIAGPGIDWFSDISSNELWFDTSVCGVDELPGTYISVDNSSSLESIVDTFAGILKEFRDSWDDNIAPQFQYHREEKYEIPKSFNDVMASYTRML